MHGIVTVNKINDMTIDVGVTLAWHWYDIVLCWRQKNKLWLHSLRRGNLAYM